MLIIDLELSPPTRQELQAERDRLKGLRKRSLRSGLISDGLHALVLLSFYYFGILSGRSLVVAVLSGTVIAIALTTGNRQQYVGIGKLALPVILFGSGIAVGATLIGYFAESPASAIVAGIATCSLIATGRLLGSRIMQVMSALEALEPVSEEHPAYRELLKLCRHHSELDEYRHQARNILRPFLTFGELEAMQRWVAGRRPCNESRALS